MTSSVPINASPTLAAWVGLLRLHSGATRQVSAELVREHGLTLSDFEVRQIARGAATSQPLKQAALRKVQEAK